MRIISGKYRGRKLKSPPSLKTRPTSDRLRETLFNVLAPRIEGARFLDLCAGSGAVGIEALSRGAAHVTFVDHSRQMYALIVSNLKILSADDNEVEVASKEALGFLRRSIKRETEPYDVIFFDPPYEADYKDVLNDLGEYTAQLLAKEGIVVVEHSRKKVPQDEFGALKRYRLIKQGDSCLSFYSAS
jgi:16S rRNA (guanine(966)-N(2))-methyltransferase RsmD